MTAKSIMIQGTMSDAGKSIIAAGLCRVFAQDGYKVAPFKSQNMALNSSITKEGLEMGRAQVVQAEAAGIEPEAAMNPILLKPTTDVGSQVIVRGKPIGTMNARDYFAFKNSLVPDILDAYHNLESRFDIIVIEGAGSPAEVNLQDDDIVNMGMAKMAKAPVLLAGDIDRGGVFAQLVGTMMLLRDDERPLVKGSVVNKFRGDVSILEPGLAILEEKMGVPVVGVLPYLNVDIDDEDSMSSRLKSRAYHGIVDIAVIRLPKISNFTDFTALEAATDVDIRYVGNARGLGQPDLIILPGTKSTLADLKWLRTSGLEAAILKCASKGTPVFGICGGYQMLGMQISDPHGVEGGGELRGMGLLPTRTVFSPEKRTIRSSGKVLDVGGPLARMSGSAVDGYEIHMGTTTLEGGTPLLEVSDADGNTLVDGCCSDNVYGSYLHGFFDNPQASQALLSSLLATKGLDDSAVTAVDMATYKEQQYDLLAEGIRNHLNMDTIYRIIEEGV
ncbi:MAG: cobyric acid synthase [Eggerthellaceae bacterium]|nr:cobyric acid synthase [Eggerthellaceae bacterium]